MKRLNKKSTQSHIHDGDSVFSRILITKRISVPIKNINSNIHNIIKDIIVSSIEGKCIVEGYVKPGSVQIITFSSGILQSHNVSYEVAVQCEVCYPVDGMTLQCITTDTNKAGILAKMNNTKFNPITVFVARDHNFNSRIFSLVETGNIITVRVIGQRFELNDENIWVIAEIVSIISNNDLEKSTGHGTEPNPNPNPNSISIPIKSIETHHNKPNAHKLPNFINNLNGQESTIYNKTLEKIGFFKTSTSPTSNISIGKMEDLRDNIQSASQLTHDLSSYLLNGNEIAASIMLKHSTSQLGNSLICNGRKFHIKSKLVIYTRGGIIHVYAIPNHTAILTNSNSKNANANANANAKSKPKPNVDIDEFSWPLNNVTKVDCDISDVVSDRITMSLNKLLIDVAGEFNASMPPMHSYSAYDVFTLDIMFDDGGNATLFSIKDSYTENNSHTPLSDSETFYIVNNIITHHFGISSIAPSNNPIWVGHNTSGTLIKHNALLRPGFKLVPLEDTIQITKLQLEELSNVGSDPNIYNKLGVGSRKWDFDVLSKLQKNAIKDSITLHRQYYHWILLLDGNAIGYVSLRPDDTSSASSASPISQLRYFISQDEKYRRKGFMFSAIALALEYHASIMFPTNPEMHAIIASDNLQSRGLIIKLGFNKTGTKNIKGATLDVYSRLARKTEINATATTNYSHTSV